MECLQNPRILASYRPFALRKQLDSNGVMMDRDTEYRYGHTMEYHGCSLLCIQLSIWRLTI